MIQSILSFTCISQNHSSVTMFINCVFTSRRTYLPSINILACSQAETVFENMNLSPLLPESLKRDKIELICL